MIAGEVTDEREAVIRVQVRGPHGTQEICQTVIDTGFNGFLTLPPDVISHLRLPLIGSLRAILASDVGVDLPLHEAVVLWDGRPRPVDVLASPGEPLAGMAMLEGARLSTDAVAGGRVSIEPLSG